MSNRPVKRASENSGMDIENELKKTKKDKNGFLLALRNLLNGKPSSQMPYGIFGVPSIFLGRHTFPQSFPQSPRHLNMAPRDETVPDFNVTINNLVRILNSQRINLIENFYELSRSQSQLSDGIIFEGVSFKFVLSSTGATVSVDEKIYIALLRILLRVPRTENERIEFKSIITEVLNQFGLALIIGLPGREQEGNSIFVFGNLPAGIIGDETELLELESGSTLEEDFDISLAQNISIRQHQRTNNNTQSDTETNGVLMEATLDSDSKTSTRGRSESENLPIEKNNSQTNEFESDVQDVADVKGSVNQMLQNVSSESDHSNTLKHYHFADDFENVSDTAEEVPYDPEILENRSDIGETPQEPQQVIHESKKEKKKKKNEPTLEECEKIVESIDTLDLGPLTQKQKMALKRVQQHKNNSNRANRTNNQRNPPKTWTLPITNEFNTLQDYDKNFPELKKESHEKTTGTFKNPKPTSENNNSDKKKRKSKDTTTFDTKPTSPISSLKSEEVETTSNDAEIANNGVIDFEIISEFYCASKKILRKLKKKKKGLNEDAFPLQQQQQQQQQVVESFYIGGDEDHVENLQLQERPRDETEIELNDADDVTSDVDSESSDDEEEMLQEDIEDRLQEDGPDKVDDNFKSNLSDFISKRFQKEQQQQRRQQQRQQRVDKNAKRKELREKLAKMTGVSRKNLRKIVKGHISTPDNVVENNELLFQPNVLTQVESNIISGREQESDLKVDIPEPDEKSKKFKKQQGQQKTNPKIQAANKLTDAEYGALTPGQKKAVKRLELKAKDEAKAKTKADGIYCEKRQKSRGHEINCAKYKEQEQAAPQSQASINAASVSITSNTIVPPSNFDSNTPSSVVFDEKYDKEFPRLVSTSVRKTTGNNDLSLTGVSQIQASQPTPGKMVVGSIGKAGNISYFEAATTRTGVCSSASASVSSPGRTTSQSARKRVSFSLPDLPSNPSEQLERNVLEQLSIEQETLPPENQDRIEQECLSEQEQQGIDSCTEQLEQEMSDDENQMQMLGATSSEGNSENSGSDMDGEEDFHDAVMDESEVISPVNSVPPLIGTGIDAGTDTGTPDLTTHQPARRIMRLFTPSPTPPIPDPSSHSEDDSSEGFDSEINPRPVDTTTHRKLTSLYSITSVRREVKRKPVFSSGIGISCSSESESDKTDSEADSDECEDEEITMKFPTKKGRSHSKSRTHKHTSARTETSSPPTMRYPVTIPSSTPAPSTNTRTSAPISRSTHSNATSTSTSSCSSAPSTNTSTSTPLSTSTSAQVQVQPQPQNSTTSVPVATSTVQNTKAKQISDGDDTTKTDTEKKKKPLISVKNLPKTTKIKKVKKQKIYPMTSSNIAEVLVNTSANHSELSLNASSITQSINPSESHTTNQNQQSEEGTTWTLWRILLISVLVLSVSALTFVGYLHFMNNEEVATISEVQH